MDRIIKGFNELLLDLKDDCKSFDNNQERKAKDIAGRIRTLLKDGPGRNSLSVLTQLGRKEILYSDSAIPYTTNPGFSYFDIDAPISNSVLLASGVFMGLVYKKVHETSGLLTFSFVPLFRRDHFKPEIREVPFSEWWEQIVYEDPYLNYKLSRKDLILSISEKDGYAHFDPTLNKEYEKFLKSDSLKFVINGEQINFGNNPAKNSIRQIGFEVIETLDKHLKDIIRIT
jgi:hypothetical protein